MRTCGLCECARYKSLLLLLKALTGMQNCGSRHLVLKKWWYWRRVLFQVQFFPYILDGWLKGWLNLIPNPSTNHEKPAGIPTESSYLVGTSNFPQTQIFLKLFTQIFPVFSSDAYFCCLLCVGTQCLCVSSMFTVQHFHTVSQCRTQRGWG